MDRSLLFFISTILIILFGLIIPKIVMAQNINNSYQQTLGDINKDPRNDIYGTTAVIEPGDLWNINPLWMLPLFLIPLGYWYLYKKDEKEDAEDETNEISYLNSQAFYHDIRSDYSSDDISNQQLEDMDSWYSKKEDPAPSDTPKIIP